MSHTDPARRLAEAEKTIQMLQDELLETSNGLVALTLKLSELEHTTSEFFADTSHDLRAPLHSINGFVKLLFDGKRRDPETRRRFLKIIDEQSEQLGNLVDHRLDGSRVEAGRLSLRRDPLSVERLIKDAVESLSVRAESRGVELEVDLYPELPVVEGDEQRIVQVLHNLIRNAIRSSRPGTKVVVSGRALNSEVLVQVEDRGDGIPAEALPRLFERFSQVDGAATRDSPGTGLGLYIARGIIDATGGRIWVDSTLREGSTFSFTLPLSPNPPMRSGLGVGTRGEGRGTRRSALDSDKWGRWRPLVGVGGADGGPGQRRWGGVGGTACKGRQSRTGPVRLCGVVE